MEDELGGNIDDETADKNEPGSENCMEESDHISFDPGDEDYDWMKSDHDLMKRIRTSSAQLGSADNG